jgi:hypothetical protein
MGLRRGRPRKHGHRELNGRLVRIKDAERDRDMLEKITVLKQPHRRGDADQFCESAVGRFVLQHKLPRAVYDASQEWAGLIRHHYAAKTETQPLVQLGVGNGLGVTTKKATWLTEQILWIESSLRQLSPLGFRAARDLAVYEIPVPAGSTTEAIGVLLGLARLLRKLGRNG